MEQKKTTIYNIHYDHTVVEHTNYYLSNDNPET